MSRTVPFNTISGIDRQRFPVEQFGPAGPTARIGLTNGSLRPLAPIGRGAGFFSATTAGVSGGLAATALTRGAGFTTFVLADLVASDFFWPVLVELGVADFRAVWAAVPFFVA